MCKKIRFVKVKIFIIFFTYMSCVYLNRIVPGIRYGQSTFTILKTDKLSMPDISPFSIKFDNSVTNSTFPIEILREKNHKKMLQSVILVPNLLAK